jgi:hypothetical protein
VTDEEARAILEEEGIDVDAAYSRLMLKIELRANLERRLDGLESRLLELERHPNACPATKQEIASIRSAISSTRRLIELGPPVGLS